MFIQRIYLTAKWGIFANLQTHHYIETYDDWVAELFEDSEENGETA